MKKLLTIALCVVFVGVMAVSAFAGALDLADYGQITITLNEGATTPVADGAISDGEYEYEFTATEASETVYLAGESALADTTYVTFYLAADADYIYVATKTDDSDVVDWQEGIFVNFALDNTDAAVRVFASDCGDPEVLSDDRANWSAYFAGSARSAADGVTINEVVFSRAKIAQFLGADSFDKITVSISQNTNCAADSAVVWGFQSPAAEELGYPAYAYPTWGLPHVVEIVGEPVVNDTDAPAEDTAESTEDIAAPEEDTADSTEDTAAPADDNVADSETPAVEKSGCGASVAAISVALVATLGTCVVFIKKK